jgi:hypothetical protein
LHEAVFAPAAGAVSLATKNEQMMTEGEVL